jgi:G:T-mismatch repair DNA endonuclease (very short patch repair protein)
MQALLNAGRTSCADKRLGEGRWEPSGPLLCCQDKSCRNTLCVDQSGSFWHRHEGCRFKTSPGTRPEFWQEKFDANVKRDKSNEAALLAQGWRIATVWECAIKHAPLDALERLSSWIPSDQVTIEIGTNDAGTMPAP